MNRATTNREIDTMRTPEMTDLPTGAVAYLHPIAALTRDRAIRHGATAPDARARRGDACFDRVSIDRAARQVLIAVTPSRASETGAR
jgi:hypothetical protein